MNDLIVDTEKKKTKIKSLTGLKAIAMVLIFYWHLPISQPAVDLGARCCEFLFLASGFLVGYNYIDKGTKHLFFNSLSYTAKKLSQFFLLYLITLVPLFIFKLLSDGFSLSLIGTLGINVLLLQSWNTLSNLFTSINGPTWFISALLVCYLLSLCMVFLISKKRLLFLVLIFCLTVGFRIAVELLVINYLPVISIHTFPIVRALEFFIGLQIANFISIIRNIEWFKKDHKAFFTALEIVLLGVIVLACVYFNGALRCWFVCLFAILLFVFSLDGGYISDFLGSKPFDWFSKIQMEVFILHYPVIFFVCKINNYLSINLYIISIICFIVTIVLSVLYKKFLKRSFTKATDRLFRRLLKHDG